MPWLNDADSKRHNKDAHGAQGEKWRKVANAVLEQSGDEGKAIRVANAALHHHMTGAKKRFGKKRS